MRLSPLLARSGPLSLCLLLLSACQIGSDSAEAYSEMGYEVASEDIAPTRQVAAPSPQASSAVPGRRAPVLIRRADMAMRVDDYAEAAAAVPEIVGRFDGYLAGEREQRSDLRVSNTFTVRVASSEFDALLAALTELAAEVDRRQVTVDDVTEEFVDLEARLRARRAVEAQYVALLGRADRVTDVIAVQEQLSAVREEIERAEGRLRYLSDRAAMSTVEVTLYEASPASLAGGPVFLDEIGGAFGAGWRTLLLLIVGAVAIWPLWLVLGVGLFAWRRLQRHRPEQDLATADAETA